MKQTATFLLILSALLFASSCGSEGTPVKTPETNDITISETTEAVTESVGVSDGLGEFDFGGDSFDINTRETNWFYPYLDRQEMTGDLVDDAIYMQNRALEERFNFVFNEQYSDISVEGNDGPRKYLLAGDDTYDVFEGRMPQMFAYAAENLIHKLDDLEYINPTKPYWDSQLYDELSVGQNHYFVVGAFCICSYDYTHVLLFNKKMVADYDLGDIYEIVRSGEWTLETFESMGRKVISDLDGNGVMDGDDQYGYIAIPKVVMPAFWVTAGATAVKKDENNLWKFTAYEDEKYINICTNILTMAWSNHFWYCPNDSSNTDVGVEAFMQGKSLFADASCFQVSKTRDGELDFGVIPYPKYDETQETYYTRMEGFEVFGVPFTNANLTMTSVILEAMACSSLNNVLPTYYEKALKVKYTRDETSAEMIDLIFANRVCDIGDILLANFRDGIVLTKFNKQNNDWASTFTKIEKTMQKDMDNYNNTIGATE